jgi:CelD/BcsL family acetyltransferase involved in cellulose biosynthesis
MTDLRLVPFDALTSEDLDAWHRLRDANPLLDSACFHPGFAAAVHAACGNVQVAVVREGDKVTALLPVQRDRSVLRPVGWPGCDFQGPVLAPGTAFPALDLLGGGVHSFAFDHLAEGLDGFEPWIESRQVSPFLDVSGGFDAYRSRVSKAGREKLGRVRGAVRKAEQALGPVRFEFASGRADVLERLVELKREQYARTGARDYFAAPGHRDLVARLLRTDEDGFAGVLSTLHAGERLVAAHFGVRSGGVLHWWFPVYDTEFSNVSPGWILLKEIVTAAPANGVTRIDLGRGDDDYKRRAKTGETMVCQGVVSRNGVRRTLRRARGSVVEAVKDSRLAPGLREVVHRARALRR